MSSDSLKLESSVNSVRMFWRVRHFRTCSREEMSIIIVTVVHGIRPHRDDCLAPPCLFLVQKTRKQESKTCSVYILIARVQGRIKRYRGGGRKGDGLRCEGGGGGVWETTKKYRWSTNVTTKSFNKHNNNNFLNTT